MLRMQQKSTQKILLFSVAAQKVEKIKVLCKTLGISVQQVEKSDYGQKLGAIAGITGFKKDGSRYSGADFPAELLVFSGINSSQMDIFLAEYKKAGIEPIGCKAVVTPDDELIWSGDTEQSLGYIHLSVKPVRSDKITIRLKGAAKEADAFKQIVEVVEPSTGDLDLLRAKNGEKTNNELRIVEVGFLETINR